MIILTTRVMITLLAIIPALAGASEWRYIASAKNGNQVFVDVASVRVVPSDRAIRNFEVRDIWVKTAIPNSATFEQVALNRVNCHQNTVLIVSLTEYDSDGNATKTINQMDIDLNYKVSVPDTVGNAIIEFVCGRSALPSD